MQPRQHTTRPDHPPGQTKRSQAHNPHANRCNTDKYPFKTAELRARTQCFLAALNPQPAPHNGQTYSQKDGGVALQNRWRLNIFRLILRTKTHEKQPIPMRSPHMFKRQSNPQNPLPFNRAPAPTRLHQPVSVVLAFAPPLTLSRSMANPADNTSKPKYNAARLIAPGLLALSVFGGLAAWMSSQQSEYLAAAQAAAHLNDSAPPRPIAEVAQAIAAMKLVTVEIDTKVKIQRGDESWRGDVLASIEYPVRLSYGVDLSRMDVSAAAWSPLTREYVVRIPRPMRIATQIAPELAPPEVRTGWLRLRSRAGEYYVSQARKDAPRVAADLELLPDDALRVQTTSLEQVERLVRTIVGKTAGVKVRFIEDAGEPITQTPDFVPPSFPLAAPPSREKP